MAEKLPNIVEDLRRENPEVWEHYTGLEAALAAAGPLDARAQRLVKLALAIGAREELLHVAFLGVTTLGWPHATAGRAWILDVLERERKPG